MGKKWNMDGPMKICLICHKENKVVTDSVGIVFFATDHQLPLPEAFISIPYLAQAMYLIHPNTVRGHPIQKSLKPAPGTLCFIAIPWVSLGNYLKEIRNVHLKEIIILV